MIKRLKIKTLLKLFLFGCFISSYMLSSLVILIFCLFSFNRARPLLIKNISFHSNLGLFLFRIKIKKQFFEKKLENNFLLVSNHLSYLDIIVISSMFPACFVTSFEMKETPFLGQICSLGGCLFVERRSKKGISNEVKNLSNALANNLNVVIFPEATSTNGEQILRFRRPLFQAAIDAKKEILPICLNYKKVDHENVSLKNRDKVFWYGDMPFFSHFLEMLAVDEVEVEISILDKIELQNETTKHDLAELSFNAVNSIYIPVIS